MTADDGVRERLPLPLPLRVLGVVRSTALTGAAALGALCIVVFVASLLLGLRPITVASGSMEPTLPVGSLLLVGSTPASELAVGDVVTVERPRGLGLVTHRIVEIERLGGDASMLTLRGDANAMVDPEPYVVESAGTMVLHVPGLGHVALALQGGRGLLVAASGALVLVALFMLDPARLVRRRADAVIEPDWPDEPDEPTGT